MSKPIRRVPRKRERGLGELYEDPERAEAVLWGRRRPGRLSRRGVLVGVGTGMAAALGAMPRGDAFPFGLIPAALADKPAPAPGIPGKDPGLVVLNDRPLNAETPAHLLDDDITPTKRFFVRNNGVPPTDVNPIEWRLEVGGEAAAGKTFSLTELQSDFPTHSYALTLECGGNGRAEFVPGAKGNQWSTGAVGCATFKGVRLRDVLQAAGLQDSAVYVGYIGADTHLSGDPNKVVISRGVPMAKAMQDETLLAWSMNGSAISTLHGAPVRMVAGGWPASASGKWVNKLLVRDRVHDGPKMGGQSYRVPCKPVAPGTKVADDEMCIIESMPVKSLVTFPQSGTVVRAGQKVAVRGHAWAGERSVEAVQVSTDFGATWKKARVQAAPNRLAWQRWTIDVTLPAEGYYEVWAKATDSAGVSQPMVVPGWNPKGYLNNASHRIALRAVA